MSRPGPSRPTRRLLVVSAAVAAVLAVVPSCSLLRGPRVVVIGDSISRQARADLESQHGDWRVVAEDARTAVSMQAEARLVAVTRPEHIVVELGTNDALQGLPVEDALAALESILDEATSSADCVHLVTVSTILPYFGREPAPSDTAARLDEWMRAAARGRDRVKVLEWDRALVDGGGQSLLVGDRIHPNDEGRALYVDLVAESVSEGC